MKQYLMEACSLFTEKPSRRQAIKQLLAASALTELAHFRLVAGEANGFYQRLQPAPVGGGFAMEDYGV